MSDVKQTRVAFNPSNVPVMNEDTGKLIDGEGWGSVDPEAKWAKAAIAEGRIVLQPEEVTSESEDLNPAAYDAFRKAENEQEEREEKQREKDEKAAREAEESSPQTTTRKTASSRVSRSVRDTGADADNGAAKTGSTKE